MSEWQDISTAPKDGTEIIVWRRDSGAFTAHFSPFVMDGDYYLEPTGPECWFSTAGEDLTDDMPSHWMPLPTPPKEGA